MTKPKALPVLTKAEESRAVEQIRRVPVSYGRAQIPVSRGKAAVFEEAGGLWHLCNGVEE